MTLLQLVILTRGQAELRGEREGGEAKRKLKTVRAIETRLGLAHHCPDDRFFVMLIINVSHYHYQR